jgi:osmotically-inducible protein OsmY
MPEPNPAPAGRATETPNSQAATADLAELRLRSRPYPALQGVTCAVRDGVLVLRGRLPSYYLKQLAQEAVARLDGVRRIDNRIEVGTTPGANFGEDAAEGPAGR